MKIKVAICTILLTSYVLTQGVGNDKKENSPSLNLYTCTKASGCSSKPKKLTIDANWRWVHNKGGYENCYTGDSWNTTYCSDPKECAKNCVVDGADYEGTYGVTASNNNDDVTLKFKVNDNVGSRLFMLDDNGEYFNFKLNNKEFSFDVELNTLECGMNAALYFVEMDKDGQKSEYNAAGSSRGTTYCDAQCPHDLKFINGEGNTLNWQTDKIGNFGKYGVCCAEMDIFEANRWAQAFTTHPCAVKGEQRCEGKECGDNRSNQRYDGVCDKDGCDNNVYRYGETKFFGPGSEYSIDTTKKFTVVTQFITNDGTDNGELTEIRRKYVQNGNVVENPSVKVGDKSFNSITDEFCDAQKDAFTETNMRKKIGGLKTMGEAHQRGMV